MEYVPWPTLKQLLDHGTLSPQRVAQLGIAMLHPIEVMHAHNLVHRDLKPANIFVREEANNDYLVKLADLGLWILDEAHVKDGATDSLTTRNEFAGTLDYASPEQMMGSGIGARSDLHAVGSVLWCAYTGQVPFPACGEG
ncbi:MAG: protein kinase, partial [Polyangiaceae bacterium]|nr:protein kinase [Polyangiaceae bacterium]